MNPLRMSKPRQRGAAQIEFALSIMIVLFVIFSIWEMIMIMYTYNTLVNAAKEGVRYAIVHGPGKTGSAADPTEAQCSGPNLPACPDPTGANVQNFVLNYAKLSFHDISAIAVTVNYPDGKIDPPSLVTVDITYTYVPYLHLSWAMPNMHATASGRIVN